MTLIDTGPLFALLDVRQADARKRCAAALSRLSKPLITTWPCFTEAMYLLHSVGGWQMQRLLWRYVESGVLHIYSLTDSDRDRMQTLMEAYKDSPMDLADASLVATAETLNLSRILTLDSHFYAYRIHGKAPFEVLP